MQQEVSLPKILLFYDYFLPGFKAGGPVQSLANIIRLLGSEYRFFVVTSAFEVGADKPYPQVRLNSWNELMIDNITVSVFYCGKKINYRHYHTGLQNINPDFVYFNCMYSYPFFIYPLLHQKQLFAASRKMIISPRGVLQPGSLAVKSLKKKVYLFVLKQSGLLSKCSWHATGASEHHSIREYFGKGVVIETIGNIPKAPVQSIPPTTKQEGVLRLVHLSLITPVKNIHLLMDVCRQCRQSVVLDLYGPVKDAVYWQSCVTAMQQMPGNVTLAYKGALQPDDVQSTLSGYDALISLTKGENFGHALYESLSVGRPVITSFFTPWVKLQASGAGWNVPIDDARNISKLLDELALMDAASWWDHCGKAWQLAKNYFYHESKTLPSYKKLFE